jgi:glycosyltransferase involved in cell wall biosynthesis
MTNKAQPIQQNRTDVRMKLRVAVVHEWLTTYAGSEKVVEQILAIFPQAELFVLVDFLDDSKRSLFGGRHPTTSFIQGLPGARKHYRNYLPLMPLAVEQFDLTAFDLIISSNHAVAKGVITGPDQIHVSYVHSPIRYAWDLQHQYLRESGLKNGIKAWIARICLHYIRIWDVRTANGVDQFIANSNFIGRRIRKVYGRDSIVVYPPVDIERFNLRKEKENFFLAASRMVPYKRMAMIAEAFVGLPDKELIMIGDGPEFEKIQNIVGKAANIKLLGYQSDEVLVDHMGRARAFVFAAEEDFGITPVEAQACGTPVIAYGAGGALETVIASPNPQTRTGLFFDSQTVEALKIAVEQFDHLGEFFPETCRANAERFSHQNFIDGFSQVIDSAFRSQKCQVSSK